MTRPRKKIAAKRATRKIHPPRRDSPRGSWSVEDDEEHATFGEAWLFAGTVAQWAQRGIAIAATDPADRSSKARDDHERTARGLREVLAFARSSMLVAQARKASLAEIVARAYDDTITLLGDARDRMHEWLHDAHVPEEQRALELLAARVFDEFSMPSDSETTAREHARSNMRERFRRTGRMEALFIRADTHTRLREAVVRHLVEAAKRRDAGLKAPAASTLAYEIVGLDRGLSPKAVEALVTDGRRLKAGKPPHRLRR